MIILGVDPGNSGGIALNCKFKVIGITTAVNMDASVKGKLGIITPINKALKFIKFYNEKVQ